MTEPILCDILIKHYNPFIGGSNFLLASAKPFLFSGDSPTLYISTAFLYHLTSGNVIMSLGCRWLHGLKENEKNLEKRNGERTRKGQGSWW